LGERIDCPHCSEQIELRRLGAAARVSLMVRLWCRGACFNWKWAFALIAVALVCGTALVIYFRWESKTQAEAKERLEQQAQQTAAQSQKAYWLQQIASQQERANDPLTEVGEAIAREHEEQRLNDLAIETWKPFWDKHHHILSSGEGFYSGDASDFGKLKAYLRSGMTPEDARSQLEDDFKRRRDLEEVKVELHRANTLAEDAAFQHRMDALRNPALDVGQPPYSPSLPTPQVRVPSPSIAVGSYDPNSLANPYGAGSPYKPDGLMNPYSQYGSPYSTKSWRNPYATDAPKLYDSHGNYRGKLSANPYDPDSTSNPYGRFGSPYSAESINNPYGLGSPYRSDPVYVVPAR
jgi:hypothetical protein